MEPLNVRFRPKKWKHVIGNESVKKSIRASLDDVRFYLLWGDRGCGKTTMARLIAKSLKADEMDIHELDAATNRGINEVRQLKSTMGFLPISGKHKVYIVDECHRMTPEAQDAMLKALEEVPDFITFVFCTTDPNKVASTVRSRAAMYQVSKLKRKQMEKLVDSVSEKSKIKLKQEVKEELIDAADGVPREALVMLGQIKGMKRKEALSIIREFSSDVDTRDICRAILNPSKTSWPDIIQMFKSEKLEKQDAEDIRRSVLGYMSKVAQNLKEPNIRICELGEIFMDNVYDSGKPGLMFLVMKAYMLGRRR